MFFSARFRSLEPIIVDDFVLTINFWPSSKNILNNNLVCYLFIAGYFKFARIVYGFCRVIFVLIIVGDYCF